jgi:hypothetical protein
MNIVVVTFAVASTPLIFLLEMLEFSPKKKLGIF